MVNRLTLRPNGSLTGREFTARAMTAAEYIKLRRGELTDADQLELVARAVSDEPETLLEELTVMEGLSLLTTWVEAQTEAAVPEALGDS